MPTKERCQGAGCGKIMVRNSHHLCRKCDYKRKYGAQLEETTAPQPLSTLEQIGTNAVSLVQSLPVHSHHRAPLLHHLSQNITSTEAAAAFNTSASYIRECKRKNMSDSDLLTQKYSSDAAQVKQAIKSEYLSSQLSRMQTKPTIEWGPATSRDIKMIIERKINNTTATAMTDIDRDTELKPKVKSIPDIKQKHCFVYSQNQCKMYDLTQDENPTFFHFSYL